MEYYHCNRGGVYKAGGIGKRHTKSQGSIHLRIVKVCLIVNEIVHLIQAKQEPRFMN